MNMVGNIGSFVTALAFPYMLGAFGLTDQFFIAAIVLCLGVAFLWTKVRPDQALNERIIRA
jgi:ACS family glucarate transporter-like MFS transporter